MAEKIGTIKIAKETKADLGGLSPEEITDLRVYSGNKKADLGFLAEYPNVERLFVNGDFTDVDGISLLKRLNDLTLRVPCDLSGVNVPSLKRLSFFRQADSSLLTENIEYLALMEMRKLSDLSFVEKATGLKKLYLMSLPSVESLPDFEKLPNLYALKMYELHKLSDIESLTRSNIRYLSVSLIADKLSGTKRAEVLLNMERLEKAGITLDRNRRRDTVLENRLKRAYKEQILEPSLAMMEYWQRL